MIRIDDLAFVRYRAPDLDAMRGFLEDFGLHLSAHTEDALYMRAHGPGHHVHIAELGESASLGFGLYASAAEELPKLAAELGSRVEENPEPGGGRRVRFTDPAGFVVDLIHGQRVLPALPHRAALDINAAEGPRLRRARPIRLSPEPSHVMRLGHVVLLAQPNLCRSMLEFYGRLFGFKASDGYWMGPEDNIVGSFLHMDSPQRWVDHHSLAIIAAMDGRTRIDHSAFEVLDIDDVMQGHAFLQSRDRRLVWGVGRHIEGSQVFDYWRDPFGHKVEHWTDGDLVNNSVAPRFSELRPGALAQWAPPLPPEFFE